MYKILKIILSCIITFCAVGSFSGCSNKAEENFVEISNYAELKEIKSASKIKLTGNIDCGYETLDVGVFCNVLDGQGYTIKNCYIINNGGKASFVSAKEIKHRNLGGKITTTYELEVKNVTFENITVKNEGGYSAAVVACQANLIENVCVKNCAVSITQKLKGKSVGYDCYAGAIYGGYYEASRNIVKEFDCKIINSSVENSKIEVLGCENGNYANIYVGGIAGRDSHVVGCSVKNSNITGVTREVYTPIYIGGIVGLSEGRVERCSSVGNSLIGEAPYYMNGAFNMYSTSCLYMGGAVACSKTEGNVSFSYAEGNEVVAKCSGDIFVGGLVGSLNVNPINQSYAKGNVITLSNCAEGNKNSVNRLVGGLCGTASNATISSCWAYNDMPITEKSIIYRPENSIAAGFVADANKVTLSNCATYLLSVTGFNKKDEFCASSINSLTSCFISAETYNNINNCNVVDEMFWISNNTIKAELNLMGSYWRFTNGFLPKLVFN